MKKLFFASLTLLFALSFNAQAQSTTGTVNLSVTLKPIQSLTVNTTSTVDLVYANVTDYSAGVTASIDNHLTLYSTGGFTVTVKSDAANLVKPSSTSVQEIAANTIKVKPSNGTSTTISGTNPFTEVPLGDTPATIIDSDLGGVNMNIKVDYKGADANAYVNKHVSGAGNSVYTTVVTYTIAPK